MCFPLFCNWTSKTSEDFQVQLMCWNVAQTERRKKKTQSLNLKIAKHDDVCVWCAATVTSSLGKTKVSVTHSILKWHRLTSCTKCWTYNGCSDVPNGSRNKMLMGGRVVLVKKKMGPEQQKVFRLKTNGLARTRAHCNALCLTSEP